MTEQTYMDKPTLAQWNELVNAAAGGVRIETGTYTGTGTYNAVNKSSLTFDFAPKLVVILSSRQTTFFMMQGSEIGNCYFGNSGNVTCRNINVIWSGNTVSWYSNDGDHWQSNSQGFKYYYIAIG